MDITNQIQDILIRAGNYIHGRDSEQDLGITYTSILEWKEESGMITSTTTTAKSSDNDEGTTATQQQNDETRREWYKTGYDYWEDETNCAPTVDGVLGGFAHLSKKDLKGSADFIRYLKSSGIRPELQLTKEENGGVDTRACECGAGIGRVSKGLLLPLGITQCDLVEPSPRLISSAPDYLGDQYSSQCRYFCTGLQEFTPKPDYYDIIWIQWVIGYLTDDDLVDFLKRCAKGLRKGGVVVIKDNTCESEAFVVARDDGSATRSFPYILAIAELAGFRVVYQRFQEDFPDSIFPVPIIALAPKI
mmetsp:Transcript_24342/g.50988  ORF Transcript_24342/g.50988 Transcript_24342/m.50988 type:complete len:304 (-) Transcript_24342:8-919(-)